MFQWYLYLMPKLLCTSVYHYVPLYKYNLFSGSFICRTLCFKGYSLNFDTPLLNIDDNT